MKIKSEFSAMRNRKALIFAALLSACTTTPKPETLQLDGTWTSVSKNEKSERFSSGSSESLVVRSFDFSSAAEAEKFADARKDSILARLSPEPDPYFGPRKPGPTCDLRNRPPSSSLSSVEGFRTKLQLFASQSEAYGLCNEQLDSLKSRAT